MPRYESLEKRVNVRAKKPRYGRNQRVDEGVAQRTDKRLERLQRPVAGVNASDGYTGREARLVNRALAKKKDKKPRYRAAAEDDAPVWTRRRLGGYWQTRRRGRMNGTIPFGR